MNDRTGCPFQVPAGINTTAKPGSISLYGPVPPWQWDFAFDWRHHPRIVPYPYFPEADRFADHPVRVSYPTRQDVKSSKRPPGEAMRADDV